MEVNKTLEPGKQKGNGEGEWSPRKVTHALMAEESVTVYTAGTPKRLRPWGPVISSEKTGLLEYVSKQ